MASLLHIFYGLLLLMSFIAYKQRKCWSFVWQVNGWRGVIQQPFLWILLICYVDPKSLMSSIHRFGKYFQFPLAIILFDRTVFYVDDPVTLEGILTAPECINKTFLQNGFFANKGLLHAKDEEWKMRRKQLNPAFSHNTLINFLGDFNRVANDLSDKIKLDLREESRTSFQQLEDLVSRAVLEVSCLTIMGVSTHFTQNDDKGIAAAYRYLMELTALRILKPWYQIDSVFRVMDKTNFEISQKAKYLVEEFVANIVQKKQVEWQNKQYDHAQGVDGVSAATDAPNDHADEVDGNIAEKRIFIDQLFHLAHEDKLTFENVMDESQSMVVVSFETVSTCIMNVLICLALNRECQEKLRQEIKRILSNKLEPLFKNGENGTGPDAEADNWDNVTVTMAHLQCMPYLDMVLNESLRLLTTVPMNMRRVSTDFPLKILQRQHNSRPLLNTDNYLKSSACTSRCKSVIVPKGTMIAVDTFNMQRNVDLWGPNALNFHPEHFAKESEPVAVDEKTKRRHSYAFVPFSKGVRTCIGHRYSIYLSKILLIKLIGSFDFTTNIQFNDLQYYEGISLKYRNSKDIFFEIHQVTAGKI